MRDRATTSMYIEALLPTLFLVSSSTLRPKAPLKKGLLLFRDTHSRSILHRNFDRIFPECLQHSIYKNIPTIFDRARVAKHCGPRSVIVVVVHQTLTFGQLKYLVVCIEEYKKKSVCLEDYRMRVDSGIITKVI